MKAAFITLLLVSSALAQVPSNGVASACGPGDASFAVKLDKTQHTLTQPDSGKALVYFIQENGTARIGLDGTWVGANKNNSYFSVPVEPGEHHVCADVRTPRGI